MKTVIVLAMHGAPPRDFPKDDTRELFGLHARLAQAQGPEREALQKRCDEIDGRMRAWPRTPENDPFHAGSMAVAEALRGESGDEVIVGFNEFCGPSLEEALDEAAGRAERIIVVTPMLTRGGEHSEMDIPEAVEAARGRHPGVAFEYVWPFDLPDVAAFLAAEVAKHR